MEYDFDNGVIYNADTGETLCEVGEVSAEELKGMLKLMKIMESNVIWVN